MKKCILLVILFVSAIFPLPVAAFDGPPQAAVLIAALQTAQVGLAGNDFVVLHNPGDKVVDVTGWKIQYRAANAKIADTWTTKKTLGCTDTAQDCKVTIAAGENLIVSAYNMPPLTVQRMSSGFSDTGGQVRLARPTAGSNQLDTVDMLGYGNAALAEDVPAVAPVAGKAIVRKSDLLGSLVDTNSNKNDFVEGCFAPSITGVPVLVTCVQLPQEPTPPDEDEDQEVPVVYAVLEITELLPDPVSPAVDSKDEFVEIYNPSNKNVQLKGYVVQAGPDFKDTFTFDDCLVLAGSYLSLTAEESHIGLTNSGTAVRLLDPSGKVIAIVQSYGQAKPGAAWIQADGVWQWTLQPTPGQANILVVEPPVVPAVATPKKAVVKKTTTKAASATTKVVKGATAPKPKAPAAAKVAAATRPPEPQPAQNFNFLILTLVGLGVLAYATYEYKHEIMRFGRRAWATITKQPYVDPLSQKQSSIEK